MSEIHVLLPDEYGLRVCDLGQLVGRLAEGATLEEAMDTAGIDSFALEGEARDHAQRVRLLNETGDANAYWGF